MNYDASINDWSSITKLEVIRSLLGEKLGQGSAREVFALAFNPDRVVKLETGSQSFQNVREWEAWKDIEGTKWEKWFAPCLEISSCGIALFQRRVDPLPADFRPKRLPSFLSDIKPGNFGMLEGRVVALDYAFNHMQRHALRDGKMRLIPAEDWHE